MAPNNTPSHSIPNGTLATSVPMLRLQPQRGNSMYLKRLGLVSQIRR